jgi:hypothetical protein
VILTCHPKATKADQTWLKVQTNSFKTDIKGRIL